LATSTILRDGIVKALDFFIVDGLDLAPELADFLLGVIGGKNFAEALEGKHVGGSSSRRRRGWNFGAGPDTMPNQT